MMKKAVSIFIAGALVAAMSLSALAAPAPIDVQRNNLNGQERIEKTYILTPDEDPNSVIEDPFESEGYAFNLETIRFEENKTEMEKDARQTVTVETQTDDAAEILRLLASSLPYADEAGFSGTLYIDTASITTAVAGYETKYYTVTDTKEYTSMMMNDPSGIPQSTTKSGVSLKLKDISWVVTETALAGDSLVPVEYKAVASYSGSYSKEVPSGYVTTANYIGKINFRAVESLTVKVTYVGVAIELPEPTEVPTEILEDEKGNGGLIAIIVIAALALGGTALFFFVLRKPRAKIYNVSTTGDSYVAEEAFDLWHPVIDLNRHKDKLMSTAAKIIIDAKTATKLHGKPVAVLIDNRVLRHNVDLDYVDKSGYRIYIEVQKTEISNDGIYEDYEEDNNV